VTLPPFRPRSATEIVDAAIQLGRRHYAPLVTLGALVALPGLVLGLIAVWLMPQPAQVNANLGAAAGDMGLALLVTLVSLCWLFVGFGALLASAAAAYVDGRALEPMVAMRRALHRAGALVVGHLAAACLIAVVVAIGLLALGMAAGLIVAGMGLATGGAPGPTAAVIAGLAGVVTVVGMGAGSLFAYARFVNVTAAIMLEDAGAFAALGRSNALVRGHTLRVAGVVGMMWLLYLITYGSMWALGYVFIRSAEISGNVAGVLVVAVYPFIAGLLALLYYDLRIRREGYDLELMARALDGSASEATV
jgi:hypothetical protein